MPASRGLFGAGLLVLCAAAAAHAGGTARFTLGTRAETSDGLSEFVGNYRRVNPLPASVSTGNLARDRVAAEIIAGDGYQSLRALYEPPVPPNTDGPRGLLYGVGEGDWRWDSGWQAAGRLATREISRATLDDGRFAARARNTFLIDEAYVRFYRWDDWRTFDAGRKRLRIADGFIHDDYQTLVHGGADFGLIGAAPFALDVKLAKIEGEHIDESHASRWDGEGLFDPGESAYLNKATLSYPISTLESVNLSYVRFDERNGYFADLFNPVVGEGVLARAGEATVKLIPGIVAAARDRCQQRYPRRGALYESCVFEVSDRVLQGIAAKQYTTIVEPALKGPIGGGRSFLNYGVVDGRKFAGDFTLDWTLIGEWGRVTLTKFSPVLRRSTAQGFEPLPERIDFPALGLLGYGELTYAPRSDWRFRAHYLFSSGDTPGNERLLNGETYHSFIAVRPYVTLTNIFFSGGINENLRTGSLSPSGYFGHGVWTGVLDATWMPRDNVGATLTGAYLHAQRSPVASEGAGRTGEYGWEGDCVATYAPLSWLGLSLEGDYFAAGGFFVDLPDVWKLAAGVDFAIE